MKKLLSLLLAAAFLPAYAATYQLDPQHTNVTFEIDHIISTNRGKFDRKEGMVQFDPQARAEVNGKLTLLGKSQPVKLKALRFACYMNGVLQREICGGDFEATIHRSEWGIVFGIPRFPDSVRLLLQVEAIKQ